MSIGFRYLIIAVTISCFASTGDWAMGSPLTQSQIDDAHSKDGLGLLPSSTDKPSGLGLFIGVSQYPGVPDHDLNGCVNDALGFHAVLTRRFKISHSIVLTNGQAHFLNIVGALKDLIKRVGVAYDGKNRIPVVISFSGHGVQAGNSAEEDGLDELWMTGDAALDSQGRLKRKQLLSDDELKDACDAIVQAGGHVILISDSCHSGSMHRSSEKTRSVNSKIKVEPLTTPRKKLFASGTRGSRGFVFYAACMDKQTARETEADNGKHYGRLSYVLIDILSEMPRGTTYDEVARMVASKFVDRRFRGQHPQYHRVAGKEGEKFLRDDYASPHARLLNGSLQAGKGALNIGEYHGVDVGSEFKLFANMDDLDNDRDSIGTATSTAVEAMTCSVTIKSNATTDRDLVVAKLDRIRFGNFKVFLNDKLPKGLHDLVDKMVEQKQLQKVKESQCDVAVYPIGKSGSVGVFSNDALPDPSAGKPGKPLVIVSQGVEKKLAQSVARTLLRRARSDRFFSLDHPRKGLSVTLQPGKSNTKTGDFEKLKEEQLEQMKNNGVLELSAGDLFRFEVENKTGKPMYVYVFGSRVDGSLAQMYPDGGDKEHLPIPDGITGHFPPNDPFHALRDGSEERMRTKAKIIVTAEKFNFRPLLTEPDIGEKGTRSGGISHKLGQFVNELLSGGQTTRSGGGSLTDWAAMTVVFDIKRKE